MESQEKTRERRLRRAAERQGLVLKKSRARDPRALTYGTYMLVDAYTDSVVVGQHYGYGMSLDDIENALNDATRNKRLSAADEHADTGETVR